MAKVRDIKIGTVAKLGFIAEGSHPLEEVPYEFGTRAELFKKLDELAEEDKYGDTLYTEFSDGTRKEGVCVSADTDAGDPAYAIQCEVCEKWYWTVGVPRGYEDKSNYHPRCNDCAD